MDKVTKARHFFGAILLIAGTTIGAGMLAVPVMTGLAGFFPSLALFALIWTVMAITAIFFIDVNLSMKGGVNLISMARKQLGMWGQVVSWVCYLLLLYSLIAAYIAGSAPIFQGAIKGLFGVELSQTIGLFILPVLFGGFIYLGTAGVDFVNRILMGGLVISYCILIVYLPAQMQGERLLRVSWPPIILAVPTVITSFGYHIIIPSLTTYLGRSRKKLITAIFMGSAFTLVIYILFQILVLGSVPLNGAFSLTWAYREGAGAMYPLSFLVKSPYLQIGAQLFSIFAIITSFLGVSLSLSDFLTDGFKIKKSWEGRLLATFLTFVPPLIFALTYRKGFYAALNYGGAFVAILLIFIPAAMAWKLEKPAFYRTVWAKIVVVAVSLVALGVVVINFMLQAGLLNFLEK
ncbi:MAG: Tyrosine-specific transport protein [Chlamydiia bacterium]|nr:Tyrosine-specific transport protein [Chlamydiia bacterium]